MDQVTQVLKMAAQMIAPYKATEEKRVVIAALVELFLDHGFDLNQATILSIKAYGF